MVSLPSLSSRLLTGLVGLALSLAVSVAAWVHFDTLLLFLFLSLVPFLFRGRGADSTDRPETRRCPVCGFETRDPSFGYCPRDGTELE
jgi:hypothetical protein